MSCDSSSYTQVKCHISLPWLQIERTANSSSSAFHISFWLSWFTQKRFPKNPMVPNAFITHTAAKQEPESVPIYTHRRWCCDLIFGRVTTSTALHWAGILSFPQGNLSFPPFLRSPLLISNSSICTVPTCWLSPAQKVCRAQDTRGKAGCCFSL